ncbi:MAG TPA: CYCXC family (seleno)protein [Pyrinomonadaceae bacterium]|jgi:hypothetical protein
MKSKLILASAMLLVAALAACSSTSESERAATAARPSTQSSGTQQANASQTSATREGMNYTPVPPDAHGHDSHDGHSHANASGRVPAFQIDAASLKSLPPTLSPDLFYGKQKLAYQAVKEIPQTIAQLPCYCYCDEGFGHKSLHSCFVDNHAAHCAVCVDEALLAYNLQKQEGLKPDAIRERVIAQFSK